MLTKLSRVFVSFAQQEDDEGICLYKKTAFAAPESALMLAMTFRTFAWQKTIGAVNATYE